MKISGIFHHGPISGVATYKQFVSTAGYDGKVILWDADSREPIACAHHDDLVNQCAFSPDGKFLATASSDASMRVFSVPQLRLRHVYTGHVDDVVQVQFSPCGSYIATCSYDSTIHLLDNECNLLAQCIGHVGLIERFSWSPDSRYIVSCGTDGMIKQWDTTTGRCLATHANLPYDVDDICYISNDLWVAATDNGSLLIVSADGQISMPAHKSGVKCLSKKGNALLSIGYDQEYKLWDFYESHLPRLIAEGKLCSEAWARSGVILDSGRIAMSSFGSHYLELDPMTGCWYMGDYQSSLSLNAVCAHEGTIHAIGDAGKLLVDGLFAGSVGSLCNALAVFDELTLAAGQAGVVFDAESGESLYVHSAPINCITKLTSCGASKQVVIGGYDGTIVRITLQGRMVLASQVLRIGDSAVKAVSIRDGRLFCGLANGCLVIVDQDSFEILHQQKSAHKSILNAVCSYDGGFVSVSRDLTMCLWHPDGKLIDTIQTRHSKSIKCCASSKDGRFTASGSYSGTVDIYDHHASRWAGRMRRLTERGVSSLSWCEHRRKFLAAGYDGKIYEVAVYAD